VTTAKTFLSLSGKDEDWDRFCESFEATMVANTRYHKNALSLDDATKIILKPKKDSTQTDADKKKEEEEMRDHDLELYKILIDSIDKTKKGNEAYQLVKGSKEGGYEKGCFKIAF
jgi:soluble cytochrome b562